jgi:hypothetical protein
MIEPLDNRCPVWRGPEEPAPHLTPQDLEALKAEVERLKERAGEPVPRFTSEDVEALKAEVKRWHAC